jgi:hypothetical protein
MVDLSAIAHPGQARNNLHLPEHALALSLGPAALVRSPIWIAVRRGGFQPPHNRYADFFNFTSSPERLIAMAA